MTARLKETPAGRGRHGRRAPVRHRAVVEVEMAAKPVYIVLSEFKKPGCHYR